MQFRPRKCEAIFRAALRLFAEQGFDKTSIPQIRKRAGVSIHTFYKYFPSKQLLANELYRELRKELDDSISFFASDGVSYRRQFRELWTRMARFARDRVDVFLFLEIWPHAPYVDRRNRDLSIVPDSLIHLLEEMQRAKVCRHAPTIVLAAIVWGAVVQLLKLRAQGTVPLPKESLEAMEDSCWTAICRDNDLKQSR
jgi:AcrR family transcriptional regulator